MQQLRCMPGSDRGDGRRQLEQVRSIAVAPYVGRQACIGITGRYVSSQSPYLCRHPADYKLTGWHPPWDQHAA